MAEARSPEVPLLQAHYRSRPGELDASPRFELVAASPELGDRELPSIESSLFFGCDEPSGESAATVVFRHTRLEGVGTMLARTAHVEDGGDTPRSPAGYFSHVVVDIAGEGFDGLFPVELWEAPHWRNTPADLLPPAPLVRGSIDLASAHGALTGRRRGLLGRVLDASLLALGDGPGLVLVEPDLELAIAWVAWVSFALPAEAGRRLTFSTFGRPPQDVRPVHLAVTTPRCHSARDPRPEDPRPAIIDVEHAARGPVSLYGRVLAAVAEQSSDATRGVVERLPADFNLRRLGANAALVAGRADLAGDEDVIDVLACATALVEAGTDVAIAPTLAALPQVVSDPDQLRAWGELHRQARAVATGDAADLADLALARLLPRSGRLPGDLAVPAMPTPTNPAIERLAMWLDSVESAPTPATLAARYRDGAKLGLIGVNAALDRHVGAALSAEVEDRLVRAVLDELTAVHGGAAVLELATMALVARAMTEQRAFDALAALAAVDAVRAQLHHRATAANAPFSDVAAWQRLLVRQGSTSVDDALCAMARAAVDDADGAALRAQLGPNGPASPIEHARLLHAYRRAEAAVPSTDLAAARAAFAHLDLSGSAGHTLATALEAVDPDAVSSWRWRAWSLLTRGSRDAQAYVREAVELAGLETIDTELRSQLSVAAARRALVGLQTANAGALWDGLVLLPAWPAVAIDLLRAELDRAQDPPRAASGLFVVLRDVHPRSIGEVLPGVLQGCTPALLRAVARDLRRQDAAGATRDD
ncbi:MAG: hypothetical protein QOJ55_2508, partial [Solirubrobacteraceae bacterium]|nr:hypothetical protein [Solirubrobacteraceae bacterium]